MRLKLIVNNVNFQNQAVCFLALGSFRDLLIRNRIYNYYFTAKFLFYNTIVMELAGAMSAFLVKFCLENAFNWTLSSILVVKF